VEYFLEETQTRRFPFFQEGMNPLKIHQEYRVKVIELLIKEKKPLNITQVSETIEIAWATADKILNELSREGKVRTFKMGTSNCFEISLSGITEMLSNPDVHKVEVK
jgi:predicted transcriptional regulator